MSTARPPAHGRGEGTLIIIGGHEDKECDKDILREVAARATGRGNRKGRNGRKGSGKLVIAAVATEEPDDTVAEYQQLFRELGVKEVGGITVGERAEATAEGAEDPLEGAEVVFFPGGDQLRMTSQIGDSRIFRTVEEIYLRGGTIAGTSAGAAVMSETMLVAGAGDESHTIDSALRLAPGLGFLRGVVVDQHFAQRGRLSRLLTVVAQNPKNLGVGIDEDTAIVVEGQRCFHVIGSGAVYVLDGRKISYNNLVEGHTDHTLAVHDVMLHVLSEGDEFDLAERRPLRNPRREEEMMKEGAQDGNGGGGKAGAGKEKGKVKKADAKSKPAPKRVAPRAGSPKAGVKKGAARTAGTRKTGAAKTGAAKRGARAGSRRETR